MICTASLPSKVRVSAALYLDWKLELARLYNTIFRAGSQKTSTPFEFRKQSFNSSRWVITLSNLLQRRTLSIFNHVAFILGALPSSCSSTFNCGVVSCRDELISCTEHWRKREVMEIELYFGGNSSASSILHLKQSERVFSCLQIHTRPSRIWMLQDAISPSMRQILVEWLFDISMHMKLVKETYFLSINFLDRCFSTSIPNVLL
jgi:hypothetical protein